MNDRIEDLARQCMSMRFFVDTASEEFDYKKFAELIVRECITVARGADGLDATHEAWYLIEQHFGLGMSTEDKKTMIKELLGVKNETN